MAWQGISRGPCLVKAGHIGQRKHLEGKPGHALLGLARHLAAGHAHSNAAACGMLPGPGLREADEAQACVTCATHARYSVSEEVQGAFFNVR